MIRQSSPQSWALISSLLRDAPRLLECVCARARACVRVSVCEKQRRVEPAATRLSAGGYSRDKEADTQVKSREVCQ